MQSGHLTLIYVDGLIAGFLDLKDTVSVSGFIKMFGALRHQIGSRALVSISHSYIERRCIQHKTYMNIH